MSSGGLFDALFGDEQGQGADASSADASSGTTAPNGAQMTPIARPNGATGGSWMDKTAQKDPWKLVLLGAVAGLAVGAIGGAVAGVAIERSRAPRRPVRYLPEFDRYRVA